MSVSYTCSEFQHVLLVCVKYLSRSVPVFIHSLVDISIGQHSSPSTMPLSCFIPLTFILLTHTRARARWLDILHTLLHNWQWKCQKRKLTYLLHEMFAHLPSPQTQCQTFFLCLFSVTDWYITTQAASCKEQVFVALSVTMTTPITDMRNRLVFRNRFFKCVWYY